MRILGISGSVRDSGAALLVDGEPVAVVRDGDPFPRRAIQACLEHAGIGALELDRVTWFERPLPKWKRVAKTIAVAWPFSKPLFFEAAAAWTRGEMHPRERIVEALGVDADRIRFCPHDVSHAAAAFFTSPHDESAILTVDGAGEAATTAIAAGRGNQIDVLEEIRYPHSLCLLAEAFEEFLGIPAGDHRMLRRVAGHGEPRYLDDMARFARLRQDGSFELNLESFAFRTAASLSLHPRIESILGPPRDPAQGAEQHFADIAASVQAVIDDGLLSLADRARERTGLSNLCIGGDMAWSLPAIEGAFVAPDPGHAGAALGAALWTWHEVEGKPRGTSRLPLI